MATFKATVLNSEKHLKQDGTTNIKIRIYHNKGTQYISTGYFIEPRFLLSSGEISQQTDFADKLNFELGDFVQRCRKVVIDLGAKRASMMTCLELRDQITAALEPEYEFIDFIAFAKTVISETKKEKTAEWYQTSIDILCWFYGRTKIDARDITCNQLNEMIKQLAIKGKKNENPLKPGAISNYLRGIRALYNKAKKHYNNEDFNIIRIPNNPFAKVNIPKYRRTRKSLSVQDIIKIRDSNFDLERANMARDVFMIMFYMMGININDLYSIISLTRGRIEYERSKTDTDDNTYKFPLSIKIEPELKILLDRYSDIAILSFFRRRYCKSYNFMKAVNKGLEHISKELNLPGKITTNWARHSWASIARNKAGVAKADIDFCLGHVNNDYKMADIYIDIDYSIFDKSNRAVLDLLKK